MKNYDYYDLSATVIPLYFFVDYYNSYKFQLNPGLGLFFLIIYGFGIYSINRIMHDRSQLKIENKKLENIRDFIEVGAIVFEDNRELKEYFKSCPICFVSFNKTHKKIVLTRCNHIYCYKCWIRWTQESCECPLCRMPIIFD